MDDPKFTFESVGILCHETLDMFLKTVTPAYAMSQILERFATSEDMGAKAPDVGLFLISIYHLDVFLQVCIKDGKMDQWMEVFGPATSQMLKHLETCGEMPEKVSGLVRDWEEQLKLREEQVGPTN